MHAPQTLRRCLVDRPEYTVHEQWILPDTRAGDPPIQCTVTAVTRSNRYVEWSQQCDTGTTSFRAEMAGDVDRDHFTLVGKHQLAMMTPWFSRQTGRRLGDCAAGDVPQPWTF